MKVHLKPSWDSKVFAIKPKIQFLGNDFKQLVDETFDKIQRLGRLKYMDAYMLFSFPVFVVQKTVVDRKKKRLAIVDIQKLNDLVIPNVYLLYLQSDIITSI